MMVGLLLVTGDEAREKALAVGEAVVANANAALSKLRMAPLTQHKVDAVGTETMFAFFFFFFVGFSFLTIDGSQVRPAQPRKGQPRSGAEDRNGAQRSKGPVTGRS